MKKWWYNELPVAVLFRAIFCYCCNWLHLYLKEFMMQISCHQDKWWFIATTFCNNLWCSFFACGTLAVNRRLLGSVAYKCIYFYGNNLWSNIVCVLMLQQWTHCQFITFHLWQVVNHFSLPQCTTWFTVHWDVWLHKKESVGFMVYHAYE